MLPGGVALFLGCCCAHSCFTFLVFFSITPDFIPGPRCLTGHEQSLELELGSGERGVAGLSTANKDQEEV